MYGQKGFGKMKKAYYRNSICNFLLEAPSYIVGELVRHSFEINKEQSDAWEKQIAELQNQLKAYSLKGEIIFEYDIIRLGKRIDVILLIQDIVFSLEFKNGKTFFSKQDERQAEDYAIDIKNFHKESEDLYVCPILIATDAPKYTKKQVLGNYPDKQIYLQRENMETVIPKVKDVVELYASNKSIDVNRWINSPYHPTPTIIAAAVEAYTSHNISDIASSEAGQANIECCEDRITEIIDYASKEKKKCICFVTGVPGAGKTLVGLDTVAKNLKKGKSHLSVYLSGNGPLVKVLREALIRNMKERKQFDHETKSSINALIQNSYNFKEDNASHSRPTVENILIFDEAQRVWNQARMSKKHKNPLMAVSEPKLLLSIMDRHQDWAVVICLVGLGQDIHDGEVGINEWFQCGIEEFSKWELFYSPEIFTQIGDTNIDREKIEKSKNCHAINGLHLKTSIRSFRAECQCQFIDNLLANKSEDAKRVYNQLADKYPIYITRDFNTAKNWVREQVRGTQRSGVLACSSAQRLKPEGIYVLSDINVEKWFLAPSDDLRSSNMLEIVASEFKVQGLEIDWAIVCWDADLRRLESKNDWDYYKFRGTNWNRCHKEDSQRYLVNSYRVLLTRARQGMILFVPNGVEREEDPTRDRRYYDAIYEYLISCGIKEI